MKLVCLLISGLCFELTGHALWADVPELLKRAESADSNAVLELGKDPSPEAQRALRKLINLPQNSPYNRALRAARARSGVPDALLDLAAEVFFGNPGIHLASTQELPYVGGAISHRMFQLLLDDFTGSSSNGDLQYFSNVQNALIILPELIPSEPSLPQPLQQDLAESRRRWHAWFNAHPERTRLMSAEIEALVAAAKRRKRLLDLAVLLLLADQSIYDRMKGWTFQPSDAAAGTVLEDALRIAYGDHACSNQIVDRIRGLTTTDQRIILKVLAFLKRPPGLWVACRTRSSMRKSDQVSQYADSLLLHIGLNSSNVVTVFTDRVSVTVCDQKQISAACVEGVTRDHR
jgi:hypothetical protein